MHQSMLKMLSVLQLLISHGGVLAAIAKDAVPTLPGLAAGLPSKLFSGYLEPSPGHMLHYVFMESWSNPSADPVAAWMAMGRSVIQMPLSIFLWIITMMKYAKWRLNDSTARGY